MRLRSWVGALVLLSSMVMIACSNNGSSSSSSTGALYVAAQGDQLVSSFSVDLGTGALASIGTGAATGTAPAAMAITPVATRFLSPTVGQTSISTFTVNSDGTLTAAGATLLLV